MCALVARPKRNATIAAAMPPNGATRKGETSHRAARMPAVYAPTPMNAL